MLWNRGMCHSPEAENNSYYPSTIDMLAGADGSYSPTSNNICRISSQSTGCQSREIKQ